MSMHQPERDELDMIAGLASSLSVGDQAQLFDTIADLINRIASGSQSWIFAKFSMSDPTNAPTRGEPGGVVNDSSDDAKRFRDRADELREKQRREGRDQGGKGQS